MELIEGSAFLLFENEDDEEPTHEANIFTDGEKYYAVWCHVSVGLESGHDLPFDTQEEAEASLIQSGYTDFSY